LDGKYYKWLSGLKCENRLEQLTFEEYVDEIRWLEDKIAWLDKTISEEAERNRRGNSGRFGGRLSDGAVAGVRDRGLPAVFQRSDMYGVSGLVPLEFSSGKKRKQGGIPKRGNGHLRRLLIGSSWHYARPNQVSARLQKRRAGTDGQTIRYADQAMKRLHKKYRRMVFKGKLQQTAVTAVARGLAGFIWGVMRERA
jgi:transposase